MKNKKNDSFELILQGNHTAELFVIFVSHWLRSSAVIIYSLSPRAIVYSYSIIHQSVKRKHLFALLAFLTP